ncbi:hypothetical protein OS493_040568, partial [Desmophyllum pertusum]
MSFLTGNQRRKFNFFTPDELDVSSQQFFDQLAKKGPLTPLGSLKDELSQSEARLTEQ